VTLHAVLASPRRIATTFVVLVLALAWICLLALPARASAQQYAAIQAHPLWGGVDNAQADQMLDTAKAAGANMVRIDVGWQSVEQNGKGVHESWYLDRVDHVVDGAEARGLKLLFTFAETPCWASSAPDSLKQDCQGRWWDRDVQNYPPVHASDYADALAFMVRRYGDRVAAWEVWNEPNQDNFFHTSDQVGHYADMLKAAYPAAKAADPNTTILGGSLSDSDYQFTEQLYQHGVKGNFDGWAIHPYSDDRSPLDPGPGRRWSFVRGVPAVRDVMLSHGDDKPLWLTEFGWSDCTVRGPVAWRNCVDSSTQADYLRKAFHQMRSWSYVKAGVWFNLRNTGSSIDDRLSNYGLVGRDYSKKPAFFAFQDAARDVAGGTVTTAVTPPQTVSSQSTPASTPVAPTQTQHVAQTGSPLNPPATSPSKQGRRVRLHVIRKRRYVAVRGVAPPVSFVRLLGYRRHHSGRFSHRASFRAWVAVPNTGRFSRILRARRLRHGCWRFTLQRPGAHLTASALLV